MPESKQITLKNVRLSYPNLFQAKSFVNADGKPTEPKFSAVFLLDKKKHSDAIKKIEAEVEKTALEFFKKKVPLKHNPLRDGVEKEDKDGYGPEVMFVSASSKRRPQVVDRNPQIPLVETDGRPYAGCYVNAVVSFWAFDHKLGGKGVSVNLLAIQFVRDGEPFGETVNVEEAFDNEEAEESDEDPLG